MLLRCISFWNVCVNDCVAYCFSDSRYCVNYYFYWANTWFIGGLIHTDNFNLFTLRRLIEADAETVQTPNAKLLDWTPDVLDFVIVVAGAGQRSLCHEG
jgi:hypothetical protein